MATNCLNVRDDAATFHARALAFARSRGAGSLADDLAQEMVLEWLSAPEAERQGLNLAYIYEHARDRLDPRSSNAHQRQRKSHRMVSTDALRVAPGSETRVMLPAPETAQLDVLVRQTIAAWPERPRHVFERLLEGWEQRDIGAELGLTQSRISQIVKQWRPVLEVLDGQLPTDDTYSFECAGCGTPARKRVYGLDALPQYCTRACMIRTMRPERPWDATWRKFTFSEGMNDTLVRTLRKQGFGALKHLWREDLRYAAIPYAIMKRQARLLGVLRTRPHMVWREEESSLVEGLIEKGCSTESIQRRLRQAGYHRSLGAIESLRYHQHWLRPRREWSMHEIMHGLGCDHKRLRRWIKHGWLPALKIGEGRTHAWQIPTAGLIQFILAHPGEVAAGAPDVHWLITLLGNGWRAPQRQQRAAHSKPASRLDR